MVRDINIMETQDAEKPPSQSVVTAGIYRYTRDSTVTRPSVVRRNSLRDRRFMLPVLVANGLNDSSWCGVLLTRLGSFLVNL